LMEYDGLLRQFGCIAVFFGTLLEGETVLFIAGLAACNGLLSMEWVLLSAYLGALAGDQLFFFLGRFKGQSLLDRRPKWLKRSKKVFKWLTRHKLKVLLCYRFVYGFRGVTPFVIGLTSIRSGFFLILNALTALVWTLAVGAAGYYSGRLFQYLGLKLLHLQIGLAVIIAAGFGCFILIKTRKDR